MPDAVLLVAGVEAVEGVIGYNPFVNVVQSHLLLWRAKDGHADQLGVGMRGSEVFCDVRGVVDGLR